jgi:hypothetical protein
MNFDLQRRVNLLLRVKRKGALGGVEVRST